MTQNRCLPGVNALSESSEHQNFTPTSHGANHHKKGEKTKPATTLTNPNVIYADLSTFKKCEKYSFFPLPYSPLFCPKVVHINQTVRLSSGMLSLTLSDGMLD